MELIKMLNEIKRDNSTLYFWDSDPLG